MEIPVNAMNLLVLSDFAAAHLKVLDRLPDAVHITVGKDPEYVSDAAPTADIILNAAWNGELLRHVFPLARNVKWIHNLSAGLEQVMFPELIDSPVPLTNGRGVYAPSLAEWVMAGCLFFAKDLRRTLASQEAGRWEPFDLEMLAGKTMGIVGYGEIGRATAKLAHAFRMRILALRRRPMGAADDPCVHAFYASEQIREMISASDYVVACAPLTPQTRGLIGAEEIAAMKPSAIVVNVGRGPVIDEPSLIEALQRGRIRGAALDVFETEPLPQGHPFYSMRNVLLSPHSADHTVGWIHLAMEMFIRNFEHFERGEPLENLVNKRAGY